MERAPQKPALASFGHGLSIVGTLISRFATLAILILLPARMGHAEYGLFALVITAGEMIEMSTSNWYRLILVRQATGREERSSGGLPLWLLIGVCAVLAAALAVAIAPAIMGANATAASFAIALYAFSFIWFRLIVTMLQAAGRQNLIGLVEFLRGVFTLSLTLAVVYGGMTAFYFPAIAVAAATFLSALPLLGALRGRMSGILNLRISAGAFVALGAPIIIATLLTYQFGWIDRFVVQYWLGPSMVGLYVASMALARQPIDIVLNALNAQTFPVVLAQAQAQLAGHDTRAGEKISEILVAMAILGFGAAAGLAALGPLINSIFLPTFDQSIVNSLTVWLASGAVMLGLKHFVFDNIFHAAGKNWNMLGWFAVSSALAFIAALILVPLRGVEGAAISFCLGATLSLTASIIQSRRILGFQLPLVRLALVAISAVAAAASAWAVMQAIPASPWAKFTAAFCTFGAVYLATLCLTTGFRLRQFLSSPWDNPKPVSACNG